MSSLPLYVWKYQHLLAIELLQQHMGLTHISKQGCTESNAVVEDSGLVQMLQTLTSLTDDERQLLPELLRKMG